MIDDKVLELAARFRDYFNRHFQNYPKYLLDFSWPSVGVLDLLTFPLRGRTSFNAEETELVNGVAAYLGGIAYDCWEEFGDKPALELNIAEGTNSEVVLQAKGGKSLPERATFRVNISQALTDILQEPEDPFPFFEHSARIFAYDDNLISLFASGLVGGLCPYGEGPWTEILDQDFVQNLIPAEFFLARSCAAYYRRVFPGELLGQSIELYRSSLIFPPPGHREQFPLTTAMSRVIPYLKEQNATKEDIVKLALNLSLSPDELISGVGFVLSVALLDGPPSIPLQSVGESRGRRSVELRPAMMYARRNLNKPADFLYCLEQRDFKTARELFEQELAVGLLPLFRLPFSVFESKEFFPLGQALGWSLAQPARDFIDKLRSNVTPDIVLQGVFLDIYRRDFDRAEAELKKFASSFTSSNPELFVNYLELGGIIALSKEDLGGARQYFEQAFQARPSDPNKYQSIANYLTSTLIALENFNEALDITDAIIAKNKGALAAHANRVVILAALNRDDEVQEQLEALARLAPGDRNVFETLLNRSVLRANEGI